MIRAEGLGEFYELMDQQGRPLKDRDLAVADAEDFKRLQASAVESGGCELELRVNGMSCVGCAWLIERLGRRMAGVERVRVSSEARSLAVSWAGAGFDLVELVWTLQRFGYRLEARVVGDGRVYSALFWRLMLSGLFALNVCLLTLPRWLGVQDFAYNTLLDWLRYGCVVFSLALGGVHYFGSSVRALKLRHWHYENLSSLALLGLGISVFVGAVAGAETVDAVWELPLLVTGLLAVRWLHVWCAGRLLVTPEGEEVDAAFLPRVLQVVRWVSLALLPVMCVLAFVGAGNEFVTVVGGLVAPAFYPLVAIGRCPRIGWWMIGGGVVLALLGVVLCAVFGWGWGGGLLWQLISGLCFLWFTASFAERSQDA